MNFIGLDPMFSNTSARPERTESNASAEDRHIFIFEDYNFNDSRENIPVFDHHLSSDNEEDSVPVTSSRSSPIPILLSSSAPGLGLGSLNRSPFGRSPCPRQLRQSRLMGFMRSVATQTCQAMDVPNDHQSDTNRTRGEEINRVGCNHLPLPDVVQHSGRPVERARSASVSIPVDSVNSSINFTEIGQTLRRLSDDFERRFNLRRLSFRERTETHHQSRSYSQNDVSREL
ncbi:uncharacterized protein LOC111627462 isoform X2 [Centruroides sculpturatus]|uniref:uncharacterized protein LOC111627462 isoform X2 n=1 Tax=Centruroides sculpturatus TaxID=218467 RepID=UPI000C6E64C7|nr:uncharacterized protein LOC111627462 isoform X2 [Centruroides sculpturatus]